MTPQASSGLLRFWAHVLVYLCPLTCGLAGCGHVLCCTAPPPHEGCPGWAGAGGGEWAPTCQALHWISVYDQGSHNMF